MIKVIQTSWNVKVNNCWYCKQEFKTIDENNYDLKYKNSKLWYKNFSIKNASHVSCYNTANKLYNWLFIIINSLILIPTLSTFIYIQFNLQKSEISSMFIYMTLIVYASSLVSNILPPIIVRCYFKIRKLKIKNEKFTKLKCSYCKQQFTNKEDIKYRDKVSIIRFIFWKAQVYPVHDFCATSYLSKWIWYNLIIMFAIIPMFMFIAAKIISFLFHIYVVIAIVYKLTFPFMLMVVIVLIIIKIMEIKKIKRIVNINFDGNFKNTTSNK